MDTQSANPELNVDPDAWQQACLKLRTDLRFYPQRVEGKLIVVIEDVVTSRYYRIGKPEYVFISQLDGETTVVDALEAAREKSERAKTKFELSLDDAKMVCEFLSKSNLLRTVDDRAMQAQADQQKNSKLAASFNPVFQKFPVCNPSRWLAGQQSLHRKIFSGFGLFLWLLVVGIATVHISQNYEAFWSASEGILSGYGWLYLAIIWLVMKVVHELGHASCCHRFGSSVREFGLAFICFFPVAYVDVTSCWRLSSKWHKMAISAAGIYVELFVAALAAIGWCYVESPIAKDLLYNIFIVASFTTIIFNINPLMKFDGYYILADYVERPKLYAQSQTAVQNWFSWLFFGSRTEAKESGWITLYGFAVLGWRILICIGIFLSVSLMGNGFGLVFAMIALGYWVVPIFVRMSRARKTETSRKSKLQWFRFACVVMILAGLLAGTGRIVLLPRQITAYGVVEAKDSQIVRASSPGFVETVLIRPDQFVKAGTPLIQLSNPELTNELTKWKLEEEKLLLELEKYRADGETSSVIAESERLRQIRSKIDHYQNQVNALVVRAGIDGQVMANNLELLQGTYLDEGDEILTIGNAGQKEILAAISQFQLDGMGTGTDIGLTEKGKFYLPETGRTTSSLVQITPKATLVPVSPLLCANVGGPLPVRSVSNRKDEQKRELLEPHITATFSLTPSQSQVLPIGRRVQVTLQAESTSLGYQLYKSSKRWLSKKIHAAVQNAK